MEPQTEPKFDYANTDPQGEMPASCNECGKWEHEFPNPTLLNFEHTFCSPKCALDWAEDYGIEVDAIMVRL